MIRLYNIFHNLKKHQSEISAAILFLLMLLQRYVFSFQYYPVMDDWFQYYGRSTSVIGESSPDLFIRPFAGLTDLYIIVPFSHNMVFIELVLIIMLCLSAYFFCKSFDFVGLANGSIFMIVLIMSPIGFEGLYWISAAARIIPSLFFIAASVFVLSLYLTKGKKLYLVLYVLCSALSVGYYEIFVPIFFLLNLIVILRHKKAYVLIIIPAFFSALIVVYYMLNSGNAQLAERGSLIHINDIVDHTIYTIVNYKKLLVDANITMLSESFIDGVRIILEKPLAGIAIILLSVLCGASAVKEKRGYSVGRCICFGVLLMLSGCILSFLLGYVRLPFRLSVPLMIGAGIIIEAIIRNKYVYKVAVFYIAIVFSICNIGQLHLYKYTNEQDSLFTNKLLENELATDPDHVTFICSTKKYWYNDRLQYFEYVKAATENYAVITGMVQYQTNKNKLNNIMPLYDGAIVESQPFDSEYINMLYIDESNSQIESCDVIKAENYYEIHKGNKIIGLLQPSENTYTYYDLISFNDGAYQEHLK